MFGSRNRRIKIYDVCRIQYSHSSLIEKFTTTATRIFCSKMSAVNEDDDWKTIDSFDNATKWKICKAQFDADLTTTKKYDYFKFDWNFFASRVYYKNSSDFKKLLRLKEGSLVYVFPYGMTFELGKYAYPGYVRFDKKNRYGFTKAVKEFVTINMKDAEKKQFSQVIAHASLIVVAEKGVEPGGAERLYLHDIVIWRKTAEGSFVEFLKSKNEIDFEQTMKKVNDPENDDSRLDMFDIMNPKDRVFATLLSAIQELVKDNDQENGTCIFLQERYNSPKFYKYIVVGFKYHFLHECRSIEEDLPASFLEFKPRIAYYGTMEAKNKKNKNQQNNDWRLLKFNYSVKERFPSDIMFSMTTETKRWLDSFPLPKPLMPAANESMIQNGITIKDYVAWLLTQAQDNGNEGRYAIVPENSNKQNKNKAKKKRANNNDDNSKKSDDSEESKNEEEKQSPPEREYINDIGGGYENVMNLATIDLQSGDRKGLLYAKLLSHDLPNDADEMDDDPKKGASCYFIVLLYTLYGIDFCDHHIELRVLLSALMYRYIFLVPPEGKTDIDNNEEVKRMERLLCFVPEDDETIEERIEYSCRKILQCTNFVDAEGHVVMD